MTRNRALRSTIAAVAVFGVLASAGPAAATSEATAERLAGDTRFGTAAAIARETFASADTAVVATGRTFADALAAASIAGPSAAPVLLVERDAVPEATAAALRDLGVTTIVILGGTAAVSPSVAEELGTGRDVVRVAGETRYGTAAAIAAAVAATDGGIGAFDGKQAVFLASGEAFPDALGVGPLAAFGSLPVLLTRPGSLAAETDAALDDLDIELVVVVGGTDAVSDAVEQAVGAKGIETLRIAGTTRYDTSHALAEFAVERFGFTADHANIARGDRFPDALTGGAHAGADEASPILLTAGDALGDRAEAWLSEHCEIVASIHVFGGTAAVPGPVADAAVRAARSC